jgi:hypothetical protein
MAGTADDFRNFRQPKGQRGRFRLWIPGGCQNYRTVGLVRTRWAPYLTTTASKKMSPATQVSAQKSRKTAVQL